MTALTAPPAPTWPLVLARWSVEPGVVGLLAVSAALYARRRGSQSGRSGHAGQAGRSGHAGRPLLFAAGLGVVAVALLSPVATYAEALLSVHMVQHLLLALVAAPLLVAALPGTPRVHPLVTWLAFAAAGWFVHFSPLFDLALRNQAAHAFEHLVFLGTAMAFWAGLRRLSHPARLLYLAVAMPQNTFLALAIFSARHPLYPTYVALRRPWGASVLSDQRLGGGIMWVAGDIVLLVAVLVVASAWAAASADDELELNATSEPVDHYKHGDNAP